MYLHIYLHYAINEDEVFRKWLRVYFSDLKHVEQTARCVKSHFLIQQIDLHLYLWALPKREGKHLFPPFKQQRFQFPKKSFLVEVAKEK